MGKGMMQMRLRFKSALGFIFLLISICACLGVGYIFYDKITGDSDIVVDGKITINYLNGKSFNLEGDKELSFSVTNNDSETKYYYIQLTDIYAKDVSYELTSSDNLKISNDLKSEIISNQVSISAGQTVNYTIKFITKDNSKYSGTIEIGEKSDENNTFASVIIGDNKLNDTSLTQNGESATLDEGFLKSTDDLGVSYYFRGAVVNNNVRFADLDWKIVKINGDGSVKLVLDGTISELSKYYEDDYIFENSKISESLNTWYDTYLDKYSDYIAYYKFCNDTVLDEEKSYYIAYSRVITNKIPMHICLGTKVNAKVGLLTADEVSMAGASTLENKSFYLYNENIKSAYYLMTGAEYKNGIYYPFLVSTDGSLVTTTSGNLLRSVRPVINIIKNAKVIGTGTKDDPYQIDID